MAKLAMTGSQVDLEVWSETDNLIEVTIKDLNTGEALNISGDPVTFVARDVREGTSKVNLTNGVGEHSDAANGKTRFKLTRALLSLGTAAQKEQTWVYEVRRTNSATTDQVVHIYGSLRIKPNVGV